MPSDLNAAIHNAAVEAQERVDRLRGELARMTDAGDRRRQAMRIQAAQVEAQRCLDALFKTEPTNCRQG